MNFTLGTRLRNATVAMTCIGALFLLFMANSAPMGLKAPKYHQDRITQSVEGILHGRLLPRIGLTAWNDIKEIEGFAGQDDQGPRRLYIVNIAPYVHYAAAKALLPTRSIERISRASDYITVLATGALLLGVANEIFKNHQHRLALSCSAYLLYVSSVWTYRAVLAPSKEFLMLPILLGAILAETSKRRKTSCLLVAASSVVDYHWGFFIFLSYLPIYVRPVLGMSTKWSREILPPSIRFNNTATQWCFCALALTGSLVAVFHRFMVGQLGGGVTPSNSNALYRVGIDSASNIHYGGIIGPLQFLMGQRLNVCLQGARAGLDANIFVFNCGLTLASNALIAAASIAGITLLSRDVRIRWILWPAIASFSMFALLFPQSWAAHPGIYSYMFTPIFSVGIPALAATVISRFCSSYRIPVMLTIYPSVIAGIVINSIRTSFLTGPNA